MQRRNFAGARSATDGFPTREGAVRSGAGADAGLTEARALIQAGRFAGASRLLQTLDQAAPERQAFYLLRAQCHLGLGQIDEAQRNFRWAQRIGPDSGDIGAQIAAIAEQQEARTAACRARQHLHGFRVVGFLGAGWEGAVYHCRDDSGSNHVLKQFHDTRIDLLNQAADWHREPVATGRTSIQSLGRALRRAPHPVFFGYQTIERLGRLEALYYPYRRLHPIGREELKSPELRLALVCAALAGQAHLIEAAGMMMLDLRVGQFLLDQLARIRYVDYGASILPTDDYRIREHGRQVQALILLLVELFAWDEWRNFDRLEVIADTPDQLQRRIDRSPGLQRARRALPALEPFLGPGALRNPDRLADPEVYRAAAAAVPARRPLRVLSRSMAWELRRGVRRVRRRLNV